MDIKEFMSKVMAVNGDPSSEESLDAITSLTDFYNNTESEYNKVRDELASEKEGRRKIALRFAETAVEDSTLSPEEIEEERIKKLVKSFEESEGE